ncbi:hypothetical protein ACOMHN_058289 [Nucella lapillus]
MLKKAHRDKVRLLSLALKKAHRDKVRLLSLALKKAHMDKVRLLSLALKKAHRDKVRLLSLALKKAHRDKVRLLSLALKKAHRDKVRLLSLALKKAHRDKVRPLSLALKKAHRDKVRLLSLALKKAHRDKVRLLSLALKKAHRDKVRLLSLALKKVHRDKVRLLSLALKKAHRDKVRLLSLALKKAHRDKVRHLSLALKKAHRDKVRLLSLALKKAHRDKVCPLSLALKKAHRDKVHLLSLALKKAHRDKVRLLSLALKKAHRDKVRLLSLALKKAHRDKVRLLSLALKKAHRDKVRLLSLALKKAHRDKVRLLSLALKKAHRDKVRLLSLALKKAHRDKVRLLSLALKMAHRDKILKTPHVRKALFVGCGLQLFQQMCGINTVIYYSASILKQAGFPPSQAIWLVCVPFGVNFLATFIGLWAVERLGRKCLLVVSFIGVIIALIVLAMGFLLSFQNSPSVSMNTTVTFSNGTQVVDECQTYSICDDFAANDKCGFCHDENSDGLATCLAAYDNDKELYSDYGRCSRDYQPSAKENMKWTYGYCPTDYTWMAVLGLALFVLSFAPGLGPMPWTVNSEIYPMWARSTGVSIATMVNWAFNLLVSFTFFTLLENITKYGTFFLFMGICGLGTLFTIFFVPETKNKTLEEVEELFMSPAVREKSQRDRMAAREAMQMDNKGLSASASSVADDANRV